MIFPASGITPREPGETTSVLLLPEGCRILDRPGWDTVERVQFAYLQQYVLRCRAYTGPDQVLHLGLGIHPAWGVSRGQLSAACRELVLEPVDLVPASTEFPPPLPAAVLSNDGEALDCDEPTWPRYIPPYRPTPDADLLPLWLVPANCGPAFALDKGHWRVIEAWGDPLRSVPALIQELRRVQPGIEIRMCSHRRWRRPGGVGSGDLASLEQQHGLAAQLGVPLQ